MKLTINRTLFYLLRMVTLFSCCVFYSGVLLFTEAQAQDTVTTRSIRGQQQAAGSELVINQIDTSEFPKVTVFATVLKDGVPQQGLSASDFRVKEDEVDQEPLTVVPKLSPLSVVVALDVSGSMKKALGQAQQAAVEFVEALGASDRVAALSFARKVEVISPFTQGKQHAKSSLRNTVARGDTALYDALYTSVEVLKLRPGRKAVILLSDGVDDDGYGRQLSKHSVADVLAVARTVNVPIYAIGLGNEMDERVLNQVSAETGARYYNAPEASDLAALYESIGKELSGQYNIYYTSNLPADGSVHRVSLAYGGQASIKEYTAPGSERVKKQAEVVAESSRTISFGLGTIILSGLKNQQVTLLREGKKVESFWQNRSQLKVPSGKYELEFGKYRMPFTVEPGTEKELPVATLKLPGLKTQQVPLYREGKKVSSFWQNRSQLKVPAGDYELRFGDYRQSLSVQAGEVVDVPVATLKFPGLKGQRVHVSREGKKIEFFWQNRPQIKVPPGSYKLKFGEYGDREITVQSGETLNLSQ